MKVFISQPMSGKTDAEIKEEREHIISHLKSMYGEDIEVIDSFFEGVPHDAKPLWFLGESIKKLSEADIAYFAKDWNKYRGCTIENLCAKSYGILRLYDNGNEELN